MEEGSRGFKMRAQHSSCLVAMKRAVYEVSSSIYSDPATLHAKVCNQSRNVPAGRWKKAPEGSKCERAHVVCLVIVEVTCIKFGRSAIVDVGPAAALHEKVRCNQSRNVPAGRWIGLEKASPAE